MPGPLLAVDAPSLLYRAFFALPSLDQRRRRAPRQRPAGDGEPRPAGRERHDPARRRAVLGRRGRRLPRRAFPAYHADRPTMPDELARQWERRARVLRRLRLVLAGHRATSRPTTCSARWPPSRRRPAAARCCSPATATCSSASTESRDGPATRGGKDGPASIGPAEVRERYGVEPRRCPTSSPCAATPPTGCRAPRASARRARRRSCASTATSRRSSPTRARAGRA